MLPTIYIVGLTEPRQHLCTKVLACTRNERRGCGCVWRWWGQGAQDWTEILLLFCRLRPTMWTSALRRASQACLMTLIVVSSSVFSLLVVAGAVNDDWQK